MKDFRMFNKLFVVLCTSLVLCSSFAATADVTNTNANHTIPAAEVKIYNSTIGDYIVGIRPARDFYGTKNQLRAAQESLNDIKALRLYEGFTRAEQALETFEAKHRGRYNYSREGAKQTNAERKKLNDNLDEMKYFAQDRLLRIIDSDSRNRKKADDAAAKKKAEAAAAAKKIEDARLDKIAADKVIEDARVAKIAADKVKEDARLAKIAAA